jgi:hypothetical protein
MQNLIARTNREKETLQTYAVQVGDATALGSARVAAGVVTQKSAMHVG